MNPNRRRFHIRFKRSVYTPLLAVILGVSFASVFFILKGSMKSQNSIRNGDSKYKNIQNNDSEQYENIPDPADPPDDPDQTEQPLPTSNHNQNNQQKANHQNKDQFKKEDEKSNRTQNIEPQNASQKLKYKYSYLINDTPSGLNSCLDREKYNLELLRPFGLDPETHKSEDSYVLVLGSGGLVGSALKRILEKEHNYKTLHVLSRHHLDLRVNNSLDIFDPINITFCFFLAYEVGGAKFLQLPEHQNKILEFNLQITENVFNWLQKRQIRFSFASSSLKADNSNYGYVKRLGENRTFLMPHLGRVFRLWNAYGFEYPGPKSHAIPDFVFQGLAKKKISMLTSGKELRQFTHVRDISEALIAIMEYFDEAPLEIDISDGNWLTLADTARAAQKAAGKAFINLSRNQNTQIKDVKKNENVNSSNIVNGVELVIPEKAAKVQKRCEPNLTSSWHQNRWQQKMKLDEGVADIVEAMSNYINRSENGPAVTFIINCGDEINDTILENVKFIVDRIDQMNSVLSPMRVEIIAATKSYKSNSMPPCTILTNEGQYLRKAVKFAHSDPIVIMDYNVLPTMTHMYFFQREIPRDLIFYFSNKQKVTKMEEAKGETNATFAIFQKVVNCDTNYVRPNDLSFIVATKNTWLSVKVPPTDINIHDWLMRLKCGYISIRFESPVWSWGEGKEPNHLQTNACCQGMVSTKATKSGDTFIHYGMRPLIK
ncbi:hypothetical protein TRFO_19670 [Tritrichomonas foetus]|uniref:NAD-dependent epimerase/dehydratase domain-containing protein n=1 Tax=Tritrichomonas foetus TaxID=1144522 RepID=A0A1J4KHL1_9EUKA|nr:hypothetical protein TRFO_19670 [Tritrichomonas foetus]|eukprot:OHT10879.1 hypothetical protein TRFO_19670 [Tritrichomonas foetus]